MGDLLISVSPGGASAMTLRGFPLPTWHTGLVFMTARYHPGLPKLSVRRISQGVVKAYHPYRPPAHQRLGCGSSPLPTTTTVRPKAPRPLHSSRKNPLSPPGGRPALVLNVLALITNGVQRAIIIGALVSSGVLTLTRAVRA